MVLSLGKSIDHPFAELNGREKYLFAKISSREDKGVYRKLEHSRKSSESAVSHTMTCMS